MRTLVQLQFDTQESAEAFASWFKTKGLDAYIDSKLNKTSTEPITCLATDEKTNEMHYFELQ